MADDPFAANSEFWRRKVAEADAGDGSVPVKLGDIPAVPGSNVAFMLPGPDITGGRKITIDGAGQCVTSESLDVVVTMTIERAVSSTRA